MPAAEPELDAEQLFEQRWATFLKNDPHLRGLEDTAEQARRAVERAGELVASAYAKERELFSSPTHQREQPIPITNVSSWTPDTVKELMLLLREADHRFYDERDRRYAEVKAEQEKALKIKEEADKAALALASKIQEYKDEKANELRSQIEREQGERATKVEVAAAVKEIKTLIQPALDFVTSQQGVKAGTEDTEGRAIAARAEATALRAVRAGNAAAAAALITVLVVAIKFMVTGT